MSKEVGVILLGVWVVVVPYLGIPGGWRTTLLILSGIALMVVGFVLRAETLGRPQSGKGSRTYTERSASVTHDYSRHEDHEGINSLN